MLEEMAAGGGGGPAGFNQQEMIEQIADRFLDRMYEITMMKMQSYGIDQALANSQDMSMSMSQSDRHTGNQPMQNNFMGAGGPEQ